MRIIKTLILAGLVAGTVGWGGIANAAERCHMAWSHYTGWEPMGWIQDSGLAKKWGQKYGVDFRWTLINDYVESINQYTAGSFDGVAMTNMDALTIPAVGGVDTTFLVVGDFSNGNDGILLKSRDPSMMGLKGKKVKLVEFSVSHYLLARALGMNGLSEKDVSVVNTSDADLGALIATSAPSDAFVTWNPILMTGRNVRGITMVFDSSRIPGEIIDTTAVRTNVSENCKKAVVGAWYETMKVMAGVGPETDAMIKAMAKQAGGTEGEFKAQLRTTRMFYNPAEAAAFAAGPDIKKTMEFVAKFSFDHGLYKEAANDRAVGIQYPDGTVWGNPKNLRLRFDDSYMKLAADGKL